MFTVMALGSLRCFRKNRENIFANFPGGNYKIYTKLIKETLEKCKTKHLTYV